MMNINGVINGMVTLPYEELRNLERERDAYQKKIDGEEYSLAIVVAIMTKAAIKLSTTEGLNKIITELGYTIEYKSSNGDKILGSGIQKIRLYGTIKI
jgi:hypothetical protein